MSDLFEETSSSGDESAAAESTPKATQNVGYAGYHPDIVSAEPLSRTAGYTVIVVSVSFLLLGSYATLFSAFWPNTGFKVLDVIAQDTHYKYFFLLLIPTTAYFVIANWVGWQYYRNS